MDILASLIESLRSKPPKTDDQGRPVPRMVPRRNSDGSVTQVDTWARQGSNPTTRSMMPTGLRGPQIERQLRRMGE